jgi:hypothetical protein
LIVPGAGSRPGGLDDQERAGDVGGVRAQDAWIPVTGSDGAAGRCRQRTHSGETAGAGKAAPVAHENAAAGHLRIEREHALVDHRLIAKVDCSRQRERAETDLDQAEVALGRQACRCARAGHRSSEDG